MSYENQLNEWVNKEKAGVPKWLQSKLKAQGLKSIPPRYGQMNKTNPKLMKKASEAQSSRVHIEGIRKTKPKDEPIKKAEPKKEFKIKAI